MSHLRALRQELFKYQKRKRRSIDGSVPGVPHEGFTRFSTPDLVSSQRHAGGYRHDLYMADTPTKYRPNMFSPAVDWAEYRQDEEAFAHFPKTPQAHHPLDMVLQENLLPHHSSDELALTEQWLMNMGARPRPQEGPVPVDMEEIRHLLEGVRVPLHSIDAQIESEGNSAVPFSNDIHERLGMPEPESGVPVPDLETITGTLNFLLDRLPADHPDILNLKQAQRELAGQQLLEIQQDPAFQEQYEAVGDNWQSNLPQGDPYIDDDLMAARLADEPAFEEMPQEPALEQIVEYGFEESQPEAMDKAMDTGEMPFAGVGPASVDDIANDPLDQFNYSIDEINRAMDQVTGFGQPEMDPWMRYDPYQTAMMMDMQMQYLMDPYQMGPGFGPMGPMPGM